MASETDQAKDLLRKLHAAKKSLEDVGWVVIRGEGDAPYEYQEQEVYGRYVGVWWMLTMAINDVREMLNGWDGGPRGYLGDPQELEMTP